MPISEKNAARAMRMVGLDQPGPVNIRDYNALIQKAGNLAEFMDRMDQMTVLPDFQNMTVKLRF